MLAAATGTSFCYGGVPCTYLFLFHICTCLWCDFDDIYNVLGYQIFENETYIVLWSACMITQRKLKMCI